MFKLHFATPEEKILADAELEEISVPGFAGELNILPGHAPLMTTLEPGIVRYKLKGCEVQKMAISWGYCQVDPHSVTVLVEGAATGDQLDLQVIEQHLKENESRIAHETLDDFEWDKVQHEISRLQAEIALLHERPH